MVYITAGLLDGLLEQAGDRAPESVSIGLAVTPAGDIEGLSLSPETPVFTTFYMPEAGRSVEAVFGSSLGTPAGQTPGLFVSHPDGSPTISRTDDLREVVLVAIPPWDRPSVSAYGRDGRPRDLEVLDVEPPDEPFPGE